MPAPLHIKICPFCMVDARTDASTCAYCGSDYDHVGTSAAPRDLATHTRRRTYDGTPDHAAILVSLDA